MNKISKIEYVPIWKVKNNPNNPRLVKDDKFKKLVKSIQDFPEMLDKRPIIVNEDMIVLGGYRQISKVIPLIQEFAVSQKAVNVAIAGSTSLSQNAGQAQLAYRTPMLLHYIQDQYIEPDIILDVTEFGDKKIEVIQCYASQFYNPSSSEPETPISSAHFFEFIKGRMLQFGRPIGVRYAEGFTSSKNLGVQDLFNLL